MNFVVEKLARMARGSGAAWQPLLPPPLALLELAAIVAAIALADWALPYLDIAALEPSPYWLPVLLLSLQYGTIAGLLAAGTATVAHVLYGFPEQIIGEDLFTYYLRIWALPMLWIGVALVLGQFRLRQIEAKANLQRDLAQRTAESQGLATYARDLEMRCQKLERHLSAGKSAAPTAPLDALSSLVRAPVDLTEALLNLTRTVLQGASVSISTVTPAGFEVVASSGWPDAPSWSPDVPASHPLYRALVTERRTVTVLTTGDEAVLAGQGLAAAPILVPETGRVIGIVKLEAADARLVTRATPEHLALIARLAAPALAELRVVVDNSGRDARAHAAPPSRIMRGWRQLPWHGAASPASGAASETAVPSDASERPPWPKRSS